MCALVCVCASFVHLLDAGVTRPDRTASLACLSASSVALIWFECSAQARQVLHAPKKTVCDTGIQAQRFRGPRGDIMAQKT